MNDLRSSADWSRWVGAHREALSPAAAPRADGTLIRMVGLTLEAGGLVVPLGGRCRVHGAIAGGAAGVCEAEAVGFDAGRVFLMPVDEPRGLVPGARVEAVTSDDGVAVSRALCGRVIDALGRPLDGKGAIPTEDFVPLLGRPLNPLRRGAVVEPLDVGVRAINALVTVGRGQRMGLFAGSGVGKSVLLGMMTRHTEADVVVVGLIGERGREVADFVRSTLGPEGLARSVVIAAPADSPPLMRLHGAWRATAIAEYFRDRGQRVLLLMDSLTRFAQAQREISLAIGEPPATKGYTPSVFARLPQLVERAGNSDEGPGSITALYTVLTEGDDHNDPIADAARAILDGHLVLSRPIAESGRYPAIDVEASVSRVMNDIVTPAQQSRVRAIRGHVATWNRNRDLISIGAYQRGSDPRIDAAIAMQPRIEQFLAQQIEESAPLADSLQGLEDLAGDSEAPQPAAPQPKEAGGAAAH